MKKQALMIHWFRRDLRVANNPALAALLRRYHALKSERQVSVAFVYWRSGNVGTASDVWLDLSLAALHQRLEESFGLPLDLYNGDWPKALERLLARRAQGSCVLSYAEQLDPEEMRQSETIEGICQARGCQLLKSPGNYLLPPDYILKDNGQPYKVYSAYARSVTPLLEPFEIAEPPATDLSAARMALPGHKPFKGLPGRDAHRWMARLREGIDAGESSAAAKWREFIAHRYRGYCHARDFFASPGTSGMSAQLHFGEICVKRIFNDIHQLGEEGIIEPAQRYISSLLWREFSGGWLARMPTMAKEPMRAQFRDYPWRDSPKELKMWQRGRTGYTVVDAAMRELWQTGKMHNRLRMIVASFLVKNLMIDWRHGVRWFEETLLDYDEANNAFSWQWSAGCGLDAVPYFRIFSPMLQASKYDPDGDYLRRWLPELSDCEPARIVNPTPLERDRVNYPQPCVDHAFARQRALASWHKLRSGN